MAGDHDDLAHDIAYALQHVSPIHLKLSPLDRDIIARVVVEHLARVGWRFTRVDQTGPLPTTP